MAVPSIVFASINVTINLFKASIAGYAIFTTAKDLGKDAGILQTRLLIQQKRLERWGDALGLSRADESEIDERLKSDTGLFQAVVGTLSSIKSLLLDTEGLQKRYGLRFEDDGAADGTLVAELAAMRILESETLIREHERRVEDAKQMQKRINIFKKTYWAVSDKAKFETLVAQLEVLNDGLYSLIPPSEAKLIAKGIVAELLKTTELGELLVIQAAASDSGAEDIVAAAVMKYRALHTMQSLGQIPDMTLSGNGKGVQLEQSTAAESRAVGTYSRTKGGDGAAQKELRVLIEWKSLRSDMDAKAKDLANIRINYLSYFLHDRKPHDLHALYCIGTISSANDTTESVKCGLVYDISSYAPKPLLPETLYNLLGDDDNSEALEFDLGDKFSIARKLAEPVYELHLGNWMHKNICSENVLFFPRKQGFGARTARLSASNMFLSGYEFGRTGGLREQTDKAGNIKGNLYAHPSYRSRSVKYRRLFDIYSFGVVLLEIGLWKRVESGVDAAARPEEVRDALLDACEEELGPSMGVVYREVVKCCLKGSFPVEGLAVDDEAEPNWEELDGKTIAAMEAKDERVNAELASSFHWKVVRELGKLYA